MSQKTLKQNIDYLIGRKWDECGGSFLNQGGAGDHDLRAELQVGEVDPDVLTL